MERIQGKGWLVVGLVLAVAVPGLGLHRAVPEGLAALVPLPWTGLFVGGLLLFACAGLYFRSHWAATARLMEGRRRVDREAAAALSDLAADVERSGSILTDNLAEVARDPQAATSEIYLDGSRAHARRLAQLAARMRHIGETLARRGER